MAGIGFGIRARLLLAFVLVAAMTFLASALAWFANEQSGTTMERIVGRQVPSILFLSSLAQRSTNLTAAAPQVLFSSNEEELSAYRRQLGVAEHSFQQALQRVREQRGDLPRLGAIERGAAEVLDSLDNLVAAKAESLRLAGRYRAQVEQIDVLQQEYRLLIGLLPTERPEHLVLLTQINRIMLMLGEVWAAEDKAALATMEAKVRVALAQVREALDMVPAAAPPQLVRFVDRLDSIGVAPGNVFELKRGDLRVRAQAEMRLHAVRRLAADLDGQVSRLLSSAQREVSTDHRRLLGILGQSKLALAVSSALSLLIAVLVGWRYVGRTVAGRLQDLAASMRAIAGGDLRADIPTVGRDEISDMAKALVVFRDALAHVRHLATHDTLTGLVNRRCLEERLASALTEERATGSLLYINLRGFKDVNDTFGHTVGDHVLTEVAARLRVTARSHDVVARLAGDDFVVVVPGVVRREDLKAYLEQVERALQRRVTVDVIEIDIQPAVGVVRYPADGETPMELLQHAKMAMNRAKGGGDVTVSFYDTDMGQLVQHRKAIRRDLRKAVENDELELVYQPKVCMRSGTVAGVEALVRWNHPERGRISPADFIPVAERSGHVIALGNWVLREGCRQAMAWREAGLGDLRMAVNMSPVQILRHDVVAAVRAALDATGLPPHLLEIEITEGVFMQEESRAIERLRALRDLGVKLAIDDFGTGYASLSYLKRLPVSCLKIDQSFVRDLTTDAEDIRLSKAIIGIAHDFGLEVVAEGVETAAHAAFLRREACDYGQGYYYAKPLPADAFRDLISAPLPWRPLQPAALRA